MAQLLTCLQKQKQKLPWKRWESVKLVRNYLNCLDELRVIQSINSGKVAMFRGMLRDVAQMEKEYREEGLEETLHYEHEEDNRSFETRNTETMTERVEWALKMLQDQESDIEQLITHFHTALNEVCRYTTLAPSLHLPQSQTQTRPPQVLNH